MALILDKQTRGETIKHELGGIANEISCASALLLGLQEAHIPPGKVALLAIEAATVWPRSLSSTKAGVMHVKGVLRRYLDTRAESDITLTAESALILICDYIDSLSERGRTDPGGADMPSAFGLMPSVSIGRWLTRWSSPLLPLQLPTPQTGTADSPGNRRNLSNRSP